MKSGSFRVVVGSSAWQLNGVNVFAEHLTRGLVRRGMDAHILFTEQDTWLVQLPKELMPFPKDIPAVNLPVAHKDLWDAHWETTVRYLERQTPCVYLPNSDFRHSCVTPLLSQNVAVIGLIQGDDPIHYEHVHRLGRFWDAIVCVSEEIAEKVLRRDPDLRPRVHVIPNTVVVPSECPARQRQPGDPLRIVYHGVLNTYQKRILHVGDILDELDRREIPVRLTIAGDGPQREELLSRCQRHLNSGVMTYKGIVPHHDVDALLREHDAYIMTSAFEGMPHAVLEAMAQGCVPVVTNIDSGIPEVVVDQESGFLVPLGDTAAFADRFGTLHRDCERQARMSRAAHAAILNSRFNVDSMVEAYVKLFDLVLDNAGRAFRRPMGTILPPPAVVNGLSIFPVEATEHVRHACERLETDPPRTRPNEPAAVADGQTATWLNRLWRKLARR